MMAFMKRYFAAVVVVCALSPLARADDKDKPNVKEILKKADEATKALTEVSYEAEYHGEGEISEREPKVRGKAMLMEAKKGLIGSMLGGGGDFMRFEGKLQGPGMDEEIAFECAYDGKKVYAIDPAQKVFTQGKYPEAQRLMRGGRALLMLEYIHSTPFSDEINAKSAKHEGVKKVGNVECDVIYVIYQENLEARWFFGKEDHLPRRVERIIKNEDGEDQGARVLIVKNLNTKPGLSPDSFRLEAPEGFKTKEFEGGGGGDDAPSLLAKGSKAPDWELKTPADETVSLKGQKGKVVVLAFWATYSGPSKLAMPGIQKLSEEFKGDKVKVWGINCWERGGDPVEYMKKKGYTFGLLVDGDKVAEKYRLNNLPAFYVIGGDGKVAFASVGFLKDKDKEIAKAVKEATDK